jgi:mTERF domain-containing protein, mitochondrial
VESESKSSSKRLFTVSYLMKSCGLSQERALLASKRVSFGTPEKPDSVLAFLKINGFTDAQVSVVIRKYPRVLVYDPEKVLSPKFKFFESLGLSRSEVTTLTTKSQNLLVASLENQIIPNFNVVSSLFSSKDETAFCIKRYPDILSRKFQTRVADNFQLYREAGVPESNILNWLKRQPRSFLTSSGKVKDSLEELKKMQFNPLCAKFLVGADVMLGRKRLNWKEKIELFKTWGFSEDEVRAAFRLHPWCMAASKEQIQRIMDFFVHEMGIDALKVLKEPVLFSLSLKQRIIPRYSVYQVLLSKGLVKKQLTTSVFRYSNKYFLEKFVECHLKEAPELLKLLLQMKFLQQSS